MSVGEGETGGISPTPLVAPSDAVWPPGEVDDASPIITTADLGVLLQHSELAFDTGAQPALYEAHVTLLLDPGTLSDLDGVHDALMSSHLLSDVPAIDTGSPGDAMAGAGDPSA